MTLWLNFAALPIKGEGRIRAEYDPCPKLCRTLLSSSAWELGILPEVWHHLFGKQS
jgi:hypothetical protein